MVVSWWRWYMHLSLSLLQALEACSIPPEIAGVGGARLFAAEIVLLLSALGSVSL